VGSRISFLTGSWEINLAHKKEREVEVEVDGSSGFVMTEIEILAENY